MDPFLTQIDSNGSETHLMNYRVKLSSLISSKLIKEIKKISKFNNLRLET